MFELPEDKEHALGKYVHRSWQKAAQLWGPECFPQVKGKEVDSANKRRALHGSKGGDETPEHT